MARQRALAPTLTKLAIIVARDSNLTFGGGTATSEVLRRSLTKRGWITDDEHRHLYALSRLTPGTNLLAYCTGVGSTTRGTAGALVALLASSLPAAIVSLGARGAYELLAASPVFSVFVLIAMSIAVALLATSAWHLAKPYLTWRRARRTTCLVVLTIGLVTIGLTPIYVLLAATLVGVLWPGQT